jgi:integrase
MKKPPPMLTPRIIADLRAREECGDPDHPGLRVRRTNAARVFFYRYRARDGALREIKLGEFGPMTLAEARKALGRVKLERERGADPQMEKQQARAEARRQREAEKLARYTVEKMVEDYIAERLSQQKRGDEGARLLCRELVSKLGERPAAAVTRRELQDEVIRPMLNRAPRCGTYLLGRIRCAYAHAAEQGRLPDDFVFPTLGIKGAPQVRRKRVFSDSELATFVRWLPRSPYSRTVGDALAIVLFTGCRSGEVVAAFWRDIDLERAVWMIRETKNGEPHDVMLSRQAIDLLKARRALHEGFVFPSPMDGHHIAQKALGLAQYEASKEKEGKPRADPIELPWTVHDLRRTAATGLAKLGCPRVVQDRILNHVDGSVSAIYDRHRYDGEARAWLQKWADYLEALTVSNVVPLRAA